MAETLFNCIILKQLLLMLEYSSGQLNLHVQRWFCFENNHSVLARSNCYTLALVCSILSYMSSFRCSISQFTLINFLNLRASKPKAPSTLVPHATNYIVLNAIRCELDECIIIDLLLHRSLLSAPFFLAMNESWALSHETWAPKH